MPNKKQLESLAEEYEISLATVKEYEQEAEESVDYPKDDPLFHGTVYNIIKNKVKKHEVDSSLVRFVGRVFK
jgi:hypothetical protein